MGQPPLTLEDTLVSQKDLRRLCLDRPLVTKEVFDGNAFYGNDLILKRYARLPPAYRLKAVIPHGMTFDDDFLWLAEARSPLPAVLCWMPHREQVYASRANKTVFRSAAPFLYVVQMLKDHPRPQRRGTIYFASHSTHHIVALTDFASIADELTHLGEEYQPVTVCMYWRDFNLGHHMPFQERGLPIVSAGHIYDPAFLFRFYHLCSMHWYAASHNLGSHLFYAVKGGCSFFDLGSTSNSTLPDEVAIKVGMAHNDTAMEPVLRAMFSQPRPTMTGEQMELVDHYLGAEFLRSPGDLRRQLLHTELLDKFGFLLRRNSRVTLVIPSCYRRIVWTALHGLAIRCPKLKRAVLSLRRNQPR